jgi:hypothetical protein
MRVSLDAGAGRAAPVALSERLERFECDAVVGEGGLVELRLHAEGEPARLDGRDVYLLLSRIGFHGPDGRGQLALREEALIPA